MMKYIINIFLLAALAGCTSSQSQDKKISKPDNFDDYWYAGKAELTSYQLEQARYGEVHSGEAVLVFVTEPFSKSKQVKLDDWQNAGDDKVSVLKLNMTKKFLTGVYPYSMMMSTFKPVSYNQYSDPLKVTTSSQEWCGHTFMQLNLQEDAYRLRGFSYFESEGDVDKEIPITWLEDELWTLIRLNPDELPTGEIEILPGTFYLRLRHQEARPLQAKATLVEISSSDFSKASHKKYSLEYDNRSLTIYFESEFPYGILGWKETYLSGFGNPEKLTTIAKRKESIRSPYWARNSNSDRKLRKELGLSAE